jgi:hypothetical protein
MHRMKKDEISQLIDHLKKLIQKKKKKDEETGVTPLEMTRAEELANEMSRELGLA